MFPIPVPPPPIEILHPEHYILAGQDDGDDSHVDSLSKIFADAKKRVHVSDVFDDGNHEVSYQDAVTGGKLLGFEPKDQESKWVPQGITSTSDAHDDGVYDGKEGWIGGWHNSDGKGVRVTFVNRDTKKYRHVLLVQPCKGHDCKPHDFENVENHAGGLVWYGDTLWVVDTHYGLRVFDMTNIWQVEDGHGVGKKDDGKGYSAAGYKYVIPRIRSYKWDSPFKFQFSFVSLDRTVKPDTLLVGEWHTEGKGTRLVQWELDYKSRKLKTTHGKAKATWGYHVEIDSMQGAVRAHGKIYISRTHGHHNGDMFGWVPGSEAHLNKGFFPAGPEDLSYDRKRDKIYTVTELPWEQNSGAVTGRYIVMVKPSDVKFD
jgi:hypothetical protein